MVCICTPRTRRQIQLDTRDSTTSQPSIMSELQANERPCLPKTRWIAPKADLWFQHTHKHSECKWTTCTHTQSLISTICLISSFLNYVWIDIATMVPTKDSSHTLIFVFPCKSMGNSFSWGLFTFTGIDSHLNKELTKNLPFRSTPSGKCLNAKGCLGCSSRVPQQWGDIHKAWKTPSKAYEILLCVAWPHRGTLRSSVHAAHTVSTL